MNRTRGAILFTMVSASIAAMVASGERPNATGGFVELHRAQIADTRNVRVVMGVIERGGKSRSGKHHHPGGEFGLVLSGSIVLDIESGPAQTLEVGDSFYQPPGEWHIVSTGASGAKTVVFRVVKTGESMVVPVE